MANLLGCSFKDWPAEYLGLPLGGFPLSHFWYPLVDSVGRCSLDGSQLSLFWGRVTLIKATVSNLPIYYLSLLKIPKGVATEIERIQKQFLWRGQAKVKPHYIC